MFRYINNLLEDRRINRRALAFGLSFTLAAFVLTKSTLIQKLKEKIMGTKASCCQSNTHNSLSSEINVENFPYTKKLQAASQEDQQQFVFVQSSSLTNEGGKTAIHSILKKSGSFEASHNKSTKKKDHKHKVQNNEEKKEEKPSQNTSNPPQKNTYQSNSLILVDKVQEVPKIDDSVKVETRGALNIIYGTTGGNSARLAANLQAEARQQKYQPKLIHLGDFDAVHFTNMDRAIFVVSTYGTGGPTSDAQVFYDWIQAQENTTLFSHLKYVVFGLGNSTFENFAGFGVKIDAKLESLGAQRLYPLGKGNAAEDTTEQDFNQWKENLWNILNQEFKIYETTLKELRSSEAGFDLQIKNDIQELDFDNYKFDEKRVESRLREYFTSSNVPIKEIQELRQKPQDSSCLHIDFDLSQSNFKYDTAGNLGVYPENDPQSVQEFATLQGYNLNDVFDLVASEDRIKLPLPTPMKVSTFLTKFCDLFGPVNKIILQSLADLSGNPQLIEECDKWINDNQSFQKNIKEKNHSIFSLIKQYQIRIPLLSLIKISNRIFPRFYTISSSNQAYPKNLHMCISVTKVNDPSRTRFGQASAFFTSLKTNYANKRVRIFHQESTFKLPQDKNVPVIMVGPGAGLAPFRAFLQEKKYLEDNKQNTSFGHCALYFGCRGKKVDYIYQNDLESFEKSNICNKLRLAFSRDGPDKVYVQDLMQQDLEEIADLFLQKGATIYVCGSGAVGEAVKEFIINMYQEKEGLIPYLAYSKISELESDKRIIMEVWG